MSATAGIVDLRAAIRCVPHHNGPPHLGSDLASGRQPRRQVFIPGGSGQGPIPVHQWMSVLHEASIVSPPGSWRMSMPRSAGLKNMPIITAT